MKSMFLSKKYILFLQSHLWLIIAGVACEIFYLFYFVRQFPLLSHYQSLTDIGYMQNHSFGSFAAFVTVMTIVFALFGLAWWKTYKYNDRATLGLILGFGTVFAFTMIFVYPGTAIDIFTYITQSIILVQHHANPMITPGTTYPHDPLMAMAGGLVGTPSPYGPLALIIDAIPTVIVGRNVLMSLLLLKFMFSSFIIIEAFLVYKILSHYSPKSALAGCLFIAWNPLILFEYSANGHNDIVLMLFVTLAVLALVKEHYVLACALLTASILVKYVTLPLFPLFLIYIIWQQPTYMKRVICFFQAIIVSLLLITIIYWPFWAGYNTILSLLHEDSMYMASFATLLHAISGTQISLDQSKLIGRVIFVFFYLYALFLSTRSLPAMLRGCFITLFFMVAFAVSKFEIWYAIWPVMLAVLTARREQSLAAFLLTYGASISVTMYVYIWVWMGVNDQTVVFIHALAYLLSFAPALLLLCRFAFKRFFEMPFARKSFLRVDE
jgi:alpha-1,6-mannosyltransferase